jgi:hypothetical protein
MLNITFLLVSHYSIMKLVTLDATQTYTAIYPHNDTTEA